MGKTQSRTLDLLRHYLDGLHWHNGTNPIKRNFFNCYKCKGQRLETCQRTFSKKLPVYGFEVDDAARKVIIDAGYGQFFTHRTGHNIGEEVHGNGTHMDNLETRDERKIIPGSCFSIEPGIYIPEEKMDSARRLMLLLPTTPKLLFLEIFRKRLFQF